MEFKINIYVLIALFLLIVFFIRKEKSKAKRKKLRKIITYFQHDNMLDLEEHADLEAVYNNSSYKLIMESVFIFENKGKDLILQDDFNQDNLIRIHSINNVGVKIIAANITNNTNVEPSITIENNSINIGFDKFIPGSYFEVRVVSIGKDINLSVSGEFKNGGIIEQDLYQDIEDFKSQYNATKLNAVITIFLFITLMIDNEDTKRVLVGCIALITLAMAIFATITHFKILKTKK